MLTPQLIARLFDRSVAARLRGGCVDEIELKGFLDTPGISFSEVYARAYTDWLAGYWLPDGPPEPAGYPDAVSFLGAKPLERGPRWYVVESAILGYLPNSRSGCYRIPVSASLPGDAGAPVRFQDPVTERW